MWLGEAVLAHRVLVAAAAQRADRVGRSGDVARDVRDPPVAQLQQVPGGQRAAEQVVVGDGVDVRQVQVAPRDGDGGDDLGHLGQRRPARLGADEHQPVDAEVGQGAGGRVVAGAVEASAVEQQLAALLGERVGEAVEEVDEPGVAHVVEQRPDRAAAALAQVPRRRVRPVAQLGDRALHRGPPVRADLRRPAQHQRDQRLRHPGPCGDGVDRRTVERTRRLLVERSSSES